jgi:cobalt-zinc-cadmium efflux system outer membrane protein
LRRDARIAGAEKNRDLVGLNRYPDVTLGVSPDPGAQSRGAMGTDVRDQHPLAAGKPPRPGARGGAQRSKPRACAAGPLNQVLADWPKASPACRSRGRLEALVTGRLLPQAELNLNSALAAYETGRAEFAMVLDAQRQLRRARTELVKARGDQQMRLAEIEKMVGEDL